MKIRCDIVSKILLTKKKILNLLNKNEMTLTQLSEELDLSIPTIKQHIDELKEIGAIEMVDNQHFKRLKYYKPKVPQNIVALKYLVGLIVIVALASIVYINHTQTIGATNIVTSTVTKQATISNSELITVALVIILALIVVFYYLKIKKK
jgi:DNA-binding transcriptional ArsR family regulator